MRYKVSPRTRLIAIGCSYTYGHGLSDCIVDGTYPGDQPSKFAWPHLLAARLGVKYINFSEPGASVKYMWHAAFNNYVPQEEDILIPLWTLPNRHCLITDETLDNVKQISIWEDDKRSKAYYKFLHNEYEDKYDYFMRINHFNYYFKDKVKLLINGIVNYKMAFETNVPNWNQVDMDIEFHKIGMNYPLAEDNAHWNEEAHAELSEALYTMIGERLGYV